MAIVFSLWAVREARISEEERTKKYTVPPPKTPADYSTVEETNIKVRVLSQLPE
ncbi:hypothetical protein VDGD_21122 [Verticillium dahliae]|nr:hypothetical protein VDGD_21122 [Verticillium dahliae]